MNLIPEWRSWWRMWSVRFNIVGTALVSALVAFPDIAVNAWLSLPSEIKTLVPVDWLHYISIALLVLGLISRVVKQNGIPKGKDQRES